ncbi:unnamed protein product [Amoebophrya sp. A25]|nr:unnamed protein product [Amoebophrya sp. A25]|eukprot:GSA25T00027811001.1
MRELFGKPIRLADRSLVESAAEMLRCVEKDGQRVAFLVVGDPLCATTHTDLILRCREKKIPTEVVHNASIMNAVSSCGLQLYRFGEVCTSLQQQVSLPFWTARWKPESFFDKIEDNRKRGCHTLCLLDIQVKERSEENMVKGRMDIFEPPRYMSIPQALSQLSQIVDRRQEEVEAASSKETDEQVTTSKDKEDPPTPSTTSTTSEGEAEAENETTTATSTQKHWLQQEKNIVGIARLGASDECIRCGTVEELINAEFGPPLHALVIPADDLHECEQDYIDFYRGQVEN